MLISENKQSINISSLDYSVVVHFIDQILIRFKLISIKCISVGLQPFLSELVELRNLTWVYGENSIVKYQFFRHYTSVLFVIHLVFLFFKKSSKTFLEILETYCWHQILINIFNKDSFCGNKINNRGWNTCLLQSATTALMSFFEPPGTDYSNQTIKSL